MIIGITGGSGSGKTTLLELIAQAGGKVIDCDRIYHDLLQTDETLLTQIENRFPGTVEQGVLQRKKLGAIVFADTQALQDLNRITHNAVKAEVLRLLDPEPALAAIDAIGLFESGLDRLCHHTVAVTAPEEVRICRLMTRDNITREYAQARIAAQRPQSEFQAQCQYTLENDTTHEAFQQKCLAFLGQLGIMKV